MSRASFGLRTSHGFLDGSVWQEKYLSKLAYCVGFSSECLQFMPSVMVESRFLTLSEVV